MNERQSPATSDSFRTGSCPQHAQNRRPTKLGRDLAVGDVIVFLGDSHLIDSIEPFDHPMPDGFVGLARSLDGFSVTLWSDLPHEVVR